ncbi:MAG: hypothetical protein EA376_07615 [Phycisphaeraceae bacterium]|nr:MAG: hypothetical protein EA376_07615 [Phycisphaeraceae bacterium]
MDDRERQITEGAGLQESRYNTEFIEWLNRWGSVILLGVLVVALAWMGWRWWGNHQTTLLNRAFLDLDAAVEASNPDGLLSVAQEWRGRGSIYELATLKAAEVYLESARRGLVPGGVPGEADDLVDEPQRRSYLSQAEELFQDVLGRTQNRDEMTHHYLSALSGLASVAMSLGDHDRARELLQRTVDASEEKGFGELARWTRQRLDRFDEVVSQPPLLSVDDIAAAFDMSPAPDVNIPLPTFDDDAEVINIPLPEVPDETPDDSQPEPE